MATIEDLRAIFRKKKPHEIAIEVGGFTGFRTSNIEKLRPEEIDRLYTYTPAGYCPQHEESTPTDCPLRRRHYWRRKWPKRNGKVPSYESPPKRE